jgi:TonB family protein
MRRVMAVLLVGMCVGCTKQVKAPPVATAPATGQAAPVTTTVDLTRVPEPAAPKPIPTVEEATAGEHPLKVSAAVAASMLESRPVMLAYPAEAKARHLTGKVLFHAIIGQDGSVKGLTVIKSADPLFVPAAVAAVQSWRYQPYLVNGQPVAMDTTITVIFTLAN